MNAGLLSPQSAVLRRRRSDAMATTGSERTGPISDPAARAGAAPAAGSAASRLERASLKKTPGYLARSWRRFRRNKLSMVAMVVFIFMVLFSFGAPLVSKFITRQNYETQNLLYHFSPPGSTVQGIDFSRPGGGAVTNKHWL